MGYFEDLSRAAELLKKVANRVMLIHHDDADGVCSAAIALSGLRGINIEPSIVCIEKAHPAILSKIHALDYDTFIYVDIGSGAAEMIEKVCNDELIIILDHHDPTKVSKPNILNLNPELYGYSGEKDVSGSTATYLFFDKLSNVKGIAWAAIVGSSELGVALRSLNRIPLEDAMKVGDVEIKEHGGKERYIIKPFSESWDRVSTMLTVLASVGYYSGGPMIAVRACIERSIPEDLVNKLEERRKDLFSEMMTELRRAGLRYTQMVQWFHVKNKFFGMGTKVLGTFTSILSYRGFINPDKYLVGFMNFQNDIPGLGEIEGNWVKVSARAPKNLVSMIEKGSMPPLSDLIVRSAIDVGGYGDGHAIAASALIPAGAEEDFIEIMTKHALDSKKI